MKPQIEIQIKAKPKAKETLAMRSLALGSL
jgi:hypothetical protein